MDISESIHELEQRNQLTSSEWAWEQLAEKYGILLSPLKHSLGPMDWSVDADSGYESRAREVVTKPS